MAEKLRHPSREDLAYVEGGNLITGRLSNGELYAVVGRDSIAPSRVALRDKLGFRPSTAMVRRAIGADCGIKARNVFVIDQPGAFHNDLAILATENQTVAVSDSRASFAHARTWVMEDLAKREPKAGVSAKEHAEWKQRVRAAQVELQKRASKVEKIAQFEDLAAKQLRECGLTVRRMAGRFDLLAPTRAEFFDRKNFGYERTPSNYFNAEIGTGPDGKRYAITLSGDERADQLAVQQYFKLGFDRVYFLTEPLRGASFMYKGGMACKAKSGEVHCGAPTSPRLPPSRS